MTTELPQVSVPPRATDETEVLPVVPPRGDVEETAVLPTVTRDDNEVSTRELPRVDLEKMPGRNRRRPDWAEDTPLDDLPTLADELLGPRGDGRGNGQGEHGEYGDEGGRGRR
ncbi:hypothetical protein ACWF09_28250 [Streptomyces sp. NPDC055186]